VTNFARSTAVENPLGNGSSLSPALSRASPSGDRLTSATLLPPIAVNAFEADAVAGALGTDGATKVALHLLDPQLPASASCAETIASKRNETSRRRGIVFIVRKYGVPEYLLSGQKDNGIGREIRRLVQAPLHPSAERGDIAPRLQRNASHSEAATGPSRTGFVLARWANTACAKILPYEFGHKGDHHHSNNPAEHPSESRSISRTDGPKFRVKGFASRGDCGLPNGANGMSDIEGKATRVGGSERGQRASFKPDTGKP